MAISGDSSSASVRLRARGMKRRILSFCRLSRDRRSDSREAMIRWETIASTSSSVGNAFSCRSMSYMRDISLSLNCSIPATMEMATPLAPTRPVRPARWT